MKPKNCSGGHLTRTQKAAGPLDESMPSHPAWIVKCKLKDFWAAWRYAFKMQLIYGLYFSYQYQIGSYQYGANGFKNLDSKTIGSSIQSFCWDQWCEHTLHNGMHPCMNDVNIFSEVPSATAKQPLLPSCMICRK